MKTRRRRTSPGLESLEGRKLLAVALNYTEPPERLGFVEDITSAPILEDTDITLGGTIGASYMSPDGPRYDLEDEYLLDCGWLAVSTIVVEVPDLSPGYTVVIKPGNPSPNFSLLDVDGGRVVVGSEVSFDHGGSVSIGHTPDVRPGTLFLPPDYPIYIAIEYSGAPVSSGADYRATPYTFKIQLRGEAPTPPTGPGGEAEATSPTGDLTAYSPQVEVLTPFAVPAARAAGIRINGDDDDGNRVPDNRDRRSSRGSGEDDLIRVDISVSGTQGSNFEYVLGRSDANLRVWDTSTYGNSILDAAEAPLGIGGLTRTVWVEWAGADHGSATLSLIARNTSTGETRTLDEIQFRTLHSQIIMYTGEDYYGLSSSSDGGGIQAYAQTLYDEGYDVSLYGPGSWRDATRSVAAAVRGNKETKLGVVGYSHGGGAVFLTTQGLATILRPADRAEVAVTAYIDAVRRTRLTSIFPETRLPRLTKFHVNYYQRQLSEVYLGFNGDRVPRARVNVDTTSWPLYHTRIHVSPVVRAQVLGYVRLRLPSH